MHTLFGLSMHLFIYCSVHLTNVVTTGVLSVLTSRLDDWCWQSASV